MADGAGAWDVAVGAGAAVIAADGADGAVGGAAGAWVGAGGAVATGLDASAGAAGVGSSAVSVPQANTAKSAAASRNAVGMMYATVLILPIATISFASFPKRAYTRIRGAL